MRCARDDRRAEPAKIHIAAKQLGLDRDTYEAMLWTLARVRCAGELNAKGRRQVLEYLKSRGFKPAKKTVKRGVRPEVPADRAAQVANIEALLAGAGRPRAYVDAMAKRMCHVDALRFCASEQLGKLIAALKYDRRRRAAQGNAPARISRSAN